MTLSTRDQQILAEIERETIAHDPRLARLLCSFGRPASIWRRIADALRRPRT
ncbi:DUF3040 domain-containing protein [Kitasatospora sp. NPDC048540]|uniref:DUF3040 domain-containing protein n=1 Tax=unclassified Kitasatospora TaxID=2633591 RepID=UPI0009E8168C|nr:DUF3040 domain-containing protein [Kitasatospora sp. MBT63]